MPEKRTNKFVAQKEKEQRQKKIIMIATAAVLVIVLGLVAYGIIDQQILQPSQAIVSLDSRKIDTEEFQERVRYQRLQLINQAYQVIQLQQSLGSDAQMAGYFQQQMAQIVQQLQQPLMIGQQVVQLSSDDLIIFEEAEKKGLELTEEEFERELQNLFGYFPSGTPTPAATLESIPTSTLSPEQLTLVPDSPTAEAGEEEEPPATSTPSADQESGDPTATPLLQPTEFTEEQYQQRYQETLNRLQEEAELSEETFRRMIKAFILRDKIREEVTADVQRTQEQVWVRHILVEDQETAQEVLSELEAGEEFVDLAAEYSTDQTNKDRGGNLGWVGRDMLVEPFAEAAFSLEIGDISDPIETDFGYHIVQLLGHEERPINQSALEQRKEQAFNEWLEEKRKEYRPEINQDWTEYVPTEPAIPAELQQLLQLSTGSQPQQNLPTAPAPSED